MSLRTVIKVMKKIYINIEIIKKYLKTNNLTIKKFCELCGIKYYNYRQLINQEGRVNAQVLYKIAITTNIKVKDMVGV